MPFYDLLVSCQKVFFVCRLINAADSDFSRSSDCEGIEGSKLIDTAYSPRLHEEELSAAASRILLRVVELWLENLRMWDGCVEIVLGFDTKDG